MFNKNILAVLHIESKLGQLNFFDINLPKTASKSMK